MIVHPPPPLLKMKKNLTEETPVVEGALMPETGGGVEVGEIGAKGMNLTPWTQHPILMYQGKNFVLEFSDKYVWSI